ncbi:sigma-70 family RNA polymerase sigma factor [Clostridium tetani]|uniref:sigma-70 family RNA polymerase sigma factor n=1 Tax=Clostridium tetani TaxID=1513 RepID=UPI001FB10CC4|nr:sigma-70 family RNA polymerase sigma factor [Clostridium tetani]
MNATNIEYLVSKAKLGDKNSLEMILDEFTPTIIKFSSCIYLSSYNMEDLIQEGYLYLFNIINKYDPKKSKFKTYANVALKNNYNYLIRQNVKYHAELSYNKPINSDKDELNYFLKDNFNVEDIFIKSKYKKVLYASLKALDKKESNIIIHYYFKKLSLKEFAIKNNISYHNCIKLKNTALHNLKENVIEKFERVI